jgi:hypothetical protein
MPQFIDLAGRKFGKLTVESYSGKDKSGNSKWKCICDCGNEKIILGQSLSSGHALSCGCSRRLNLTGKIFGNLTVTEFSRSTDGHAYWKCQCCCGSMIEKAARDLLKGSVKSCGCLTNRKFNNYIFHEDFVEGKDSNGVSFYLDLDSYDTVKDFCWLVATESRVVSTRTTGKILLMHRLILKYDGKMLVDHVDHNCSNNRKSNLRLATKTQNGQNRKNVKGYRQRGGTFQVCIVVNGKSIYEYYKTEEEAKIARKNAEIKYFGEFAYKGDDKC